jgi:hypothetical protein
LCLLSESSARDIGASLLMMRPSSPRIPRF